VEDFSATFFRVNRGEEWFRERYNPLKMYEQVSGGWKVEACLFITLCMGAHSTHTPALFHLFLSPLSPSSLPRAPRV
jgi:hypothetical protein